MIYFLQHSSEGKRGGERTTQRIHEFFKSRFKNVEPKNLPVLNITNRHPIRHMVYNLKLVRKFQPELVVTDVSSGIRNLLAVRWMKKYRRKVMVVMLGQKMTFRYNCFIIKNIVQYSENDLLRNADIILVNSEFSASIAKKRTNGRSVIVVANPGLDIVQPSLKINKKHDKEIKLLFVGECIRVKGLYYLVKALGLIRENNLVLNIAGSYDKNSTYYKDIMKIINREKLHANINFLGFVGSGELNSLYHDSTIYIMPSLSEGYGKSLAEALSFGLPIVASKVGAIPEMVEDGVNALLVEPGNPNKLASAIRRLCQDSGLRDKMNQANLEKARKLPTWDDFYKTLDEKLMPLIKKELDNSK